jgi:transposase
MKKLKPYYPAIDLHSNNLVIAIVNAQGRRVKDARLFCELHEVEKFLSPYRSRIETVAIESTFNWYWLVDGLGELGYNVVLANPAALTQHDGIKHTDDRTDAWFLAELLRLGILPIGYIGERSLRATRDLLRRRASLYPAHGANSESAQPADAHPGGLSGFLAPYPAGGSEGRTPESV